VRGIDSDDEIALRGGLPAADCSCTRTCWKSGVSDNKILTKQLNFLENNILTISERSDLMEFCSLSNYVVPSVMVVDSYCLRIAGRRT